MTIPRKSPLDMALNVVVIIAFSINIYYLFATDSPPKWLKFGNAFGWIILMYLLLKPRFIKK